MPVPIEGWGVLFIFRGSADQVRFKGTYVKTVFLADLTKRKVFFLRKRNMRPRYKRTRGEQRQTEGATG
jgi:hypothetical protein